MTDYEDLRLKELVHGLTLEQAVEASRYGWAATTLLLANGLDAGQKNVEVIYNAFVHLIAAAR